MKVNWTFHVGSNRNNKLWRRPPQYASAPCKLTISSYLFARWHLFRHVGYLRHQQQVDLWPFDLESGVRVTCDLCYLCANFSLPRPLCSRLTRQTSDVRQHHRLMPPPYGVGGITILFFFKKKTWRRRRRRRRWRWRWWWWWWWWLS